MDFSVDVRRLIYMALDTANVSDEYSRVKRRLSLTRL